jgi:hypothetical protein
MHGRLSSEELRLAQKVIETEPMRIHVHAGAAKTGSSSIQHTLTKLRERLRGTGVLYPDVGGVNHTSLLPALLDDADFPGRLGRRDPEAVADAQARSNAAWEKLETLDWTGASDLILSSELIMGLMPASRRRLHERLSAISADISYYAYIREPSARYLSTAQQWVKLGAGARSPDQGAKFFHKVRALKRVAGDRVRIKKFSRDVLHNRCVVQDFLHAATPQVRIGPDEIVSANESISGEAMVMLDHVNARLFGGGRQPTNRLSLHLLDAISAAEQRGRYTKPSLRPDIAERVEFANREDMEWLARHISPEFETVSRIDPPSAEQRPVSRISDIIEVAEAGVGALARDVAQIMAERFPANASDVAQAAVAPAPRELQDFLSAESLAAVDRVVEVMGRLRARPKLPRPGKAIGSDSGVA